MSAGDVTTCDPAHPDRFSLIEEIQSAGSPAPADVADRYHTRQIEAYWKQKNLPLAVQLLTAGIHYCLTLAHTAAEAQLSDVLRAAAKGMAYNLASFTWPGWDEPGITPTIEDRALGLDAARLHLRLAHALRKPPEKIRNAHWLLGACLLDAGQWTEARGEFAQSVPPSNDADQALFHGYLLLARILLHEAGAAAQWNSLLETLASRESEEARGTRDQLTTARRVFEQRGVAP